MGMVGAAIATSMAEAVAMVGIPCFIVLPSLIGEKGLWLAMPASECLTFLVILSSLLHDRARDKKSVKR